MHEALDGEFGSRYLQFHKRDLNATSMLLSRTAYADIKIHFVSFVTPFLSRGKAPENTATYFSGDQNICPASRFLNVYSPLNVNNKYIPQSVKQSSVTFLRV
jgi:hypothetical protein